MAHRWLGAEVEVIQRLDGSADPQLGTGGVTGADFTLQDRGQVVLVGPPGVTGLLSQAGRGLGDPACLQGASEVRDLLDRLSARRGARGVLGGAHQLDPSAGEPEGPVVLAQVPHEIPTLTHNNSWLPELLTQPRCHVHVGGVGHGVPVTDFARSFFRP